MENSGECLAVVLCGDVQEVLDGWEKDFFDAALCDPPYGLNFMGMHWDCGVPASDVWEAVSHTLKPGAPLLAFGGTRTYHRLACAAEDAGFEIRDCLSWLYGSGFPKSLDISKAIDKAVGAERVDLGPSPNWRETRRDNGQSVNGMPNESRITAPATGAARQWQGYGTALKPAWEPVILAMKPTDGTFVENALRHGVAGLNVNGCRIGTETTTTHSRGKTTAFAKRPGEKAVEDGGRVTPQNRAEFVGVEHPGRWPANVLLSHHEDCREVAEIKSAYDHETNGTTREVLPGWECHPECPVRMLDEQSGERGGGFGTENRAEGAGRYRRFSGATKGKVVGFGYSGGASRFFYCSKASRSEREAGLDGLPLKRRASISNGGVKGRNMSLGAASLRGEGKELSAARDHHPTVKPIKLCEYLARLILPPKRDTPRRLLVPFSGSGSEMIGAMLAGWDEIYGIEIEPEYVEIAEARISHYQQVAGSSDNRWRKRGR